MREEDNKLQFGVEPRPGALLCAAEVHGCCGSPKGCPVGVAVLRPRLVLAQVKGWVQVRRVFTRFNPHRPGVSAGQAVPRTVLSDMVPHAHSRAHGTAGKQT